MAFAGKFPKTRRQHQGSSCFIPRSASQESINQCEDANRISVNQNERVPSTSVSNTYVSRENHSGFMLTSAGAPTTRKFSKLDSGDGIKTVLVSVEPVALEQYDHSKDAGDVGDGQKLKVANDRAQDPVVPVTPSKIEFSRIDVFFICISIVLYVTDIGLDCSVAYKHYLFYEQEPLYFIFTVVFILVSGVVTAAFNLVWYYDEYQIKKKTPQDFHSRKGAVLRILANFLMLGPVVRYIDTIIYGVRSRQKGISPERRQYFHDQMQFERVDGAMLRLFEAFLESAPQFLLQVYIVLRNGLDGEKEGNYFLGNFVLFLSCEIYFSISTTY